MTTLLHQALKCGVTWKEITSLFRDRKVLFLLKWFLFNKFIHSFICSESQVQIRQCVTQCEPDSKAQKRTLTAAV